jgi:hypothetical protein
MDGLVKIIALSWADVWKTRLKSFFSIQMERSTQASYLLKKKVIE